MIVRILLRCKARMDEIRAAWEKLDETADVMKQLILQGDDELIDIRCGMDKSRRAAAG